MFIKSVDEMYTLVVTATLTLILGLFIVLIIKIEMSSDTQEFNEENFIKWQQEYDKQQNMQFKKAQIHMKETVRKQFATLIKMRFAAYADAVKIRQDAFNKLCDTSEKMKMTLDDIIQLTKTIKKMNCRLVKYNRKMSHYPAFRTLFAIPPLKKYDTNSAEIPISKNGASQDFKRVQSGSDLTESGASSIAIDTSPARGGFSHSDC
jgi:hypothetical protein